MNAFECLRVAHSVSLIVLIIAAKPSYPLNFYLIQF